MDEIYARINGLHTVPISEPTKEACSECDTKEVETSLTPTEARELSAVFQGASRDATKVFFLSRQRLLAAAGAEGTNLYEYNLAAPPGQRVALVATGMPEVGASTERPDAGVVRVAESGSRVYFVSENSKLANNKDKGQDRDRRSTALDLYMFNTTTRRYVFVAALSEEDSEDWQSNDIRTAEATPDGRYLLFASTNDLTPGASGEGNELYRFDAVTGEADALARKKPEDTRGYAKPRARDRG